MDGLSGEPADCRSSSSPPVVAGICSSLLVLRSTVFGEYKKVRRKLMWLLLQNRKERARGGNRRVEGYHFLYPCYSLQSEEFVAVEDACQGVRTLPI